MLITRIILMLLVVFIPLAAIFLVFGQGKYFTNFTAPIATIVACLVAGIIFFIRYPSYRRSEIINHIKKSFSESENEGFLGEQKFDVSMQGMLYTGRTSESKINWSAIHKVAQNDKYIFLYTSSINAITIPRNAFSDAKMEKGFLEMIHANSGI
jgi:YcxB-like protein